MIRVAVDWWRLVTNLVPPPSPRLRLRREGRRAAGPAAATPSMEAGVLSGNPAHHAAVGWTGAEGPAVQGPAQGRWL
jgi:hypothetical protein